MESATLGHTCLLGDDGLRQSNTQTCVHSGVRTQMSLWVPPPTPSKHQDSREHWAQIVGHQPSACLGDRTVASLVSNPAPSARVCPLCLSFCSHAAREPLGTVVQEGCGNMRPDGTGQPRPVPAVPPFSTCLSLHHPVPARCGELPWPLWTPPKDADPSSGPPAPAPGLAHSPTHPPDMLPRFRPQHPAGSSVEPSHLARVCPPHTHTPSTPAMSSQALGWQGQLQPNSWARRGVGTVAWHPAPAETPPTPAAVVGGV